MAPAGSRPFRILLSNSSSMYGGGEYYVLHLARTLLRRGHDVRVACRPDNLLFSKCADARIPTHPVDFPPQGKFLRFVRILAKDIRDHSIDIVHSNTNYDRTVAGFAARIAGAVHVTNVHSFHSIGRNLTHWVRNRLCTDRFLVDGFCVKDLLEREDGIPGEKISVIYLGVEPDLMKRDERHRQNVRTSFGVTGEEILIGHVARMVPFKGHSVLLRAFAEVAGTSPRARLMLVGDGELLSQIQQQVEGLGIAGRTIFAGFRDDLQGVYSAFDIYAHPSLEGGGETFPFAVLQALAQELPVVVTKVGDVAAMVQEGRTGFVVPDNDPGVLAGRLALLVSDPGRRGEMGREGLRMLRARFTLDAMVDAVEKVYADVVEARSSA